MNITEFLLTRIAEDEAAALAVEWWDELPADFSPPCPPDGYSRKELARRQDAYYAQTPRLISSADWALNVERGEDEYYGQEQAALMRAWHPERVLAECAVKRELIAVAAVSGLMVQASVLIALAGVWRGHPDFDPVWAPD